MSFTYPRDQHPDKAAERILRHDIHVIVVDDAEQLNESGFVFLHALSVKTRCSLLLIGDVCRLWMFAHGPTSARLAILRCFFLFWSRRETRDV